MRKADCVAGRQAMLNPDIVTSGRIGRSGADAGYPYPSVASPKPINRIGVLRRSPKLNGFLGP